MMKMLSFTPVLDMGNNFILFQKIFHLFQNKKTKFLRNDG